MANLVLVTLVAEVMIFKGFLLVYWTPYHQLVGSEIVLFAAIIT